MGVDAAEFVIRVGWAACIPVLVVVHASREPVGQFAARVVADDDFMEGIRDQFILNRSRTFVLVGTAVGGPICLIHFTDSDDQHAVITVVVFHHGLHPAAVVG